MVAKQFPSKDGEGTMFPVLNHPSPIPIPLPLTGHTHRAGKKTLKYNHAMENITGCKSHPSFKVKNHRYKEDKKNGGNRNQIMKMNQNCAETCQVNLLQGLHSFQYFLF